MKKSVEPTQTKRNAVGEDRTGPLGLVGPVDTRNGLKMDTRAGPKMDTRAGPKMDTRNEPMMDTRAGPMMDTRAGPMMDTRIGNSKYFESPFKRLVI